MERSVEHSFSYHSNVDHEKPGRHRISTELNKCLYRNYTAPAAQNVRNILAVSMLSFNDTGLVT